SLSGVDVVSPTISAGDPSTFRRVHRPHPEIDFKGVAGGLRRLRDVYDGEIWPEVMLVKGYNDSDESLESIATLLLEVRPDKVFVTVPTRPPALEGVEPAEREAVERALETIQGAVDMTGPEATSFACSSEDPVHHLLSIARFHPLREEQALLLLGGGEGARDRLMNLVQSGELRVLEYRGARHYLRGR
ncbi:MAG: hypothetical protein MUE65_04245, partial [Methanomassiliicoccales archaeon]|nr:hypothetical protein [Methanomassiliicoccales archaeon]